LPTFLTVIDRVMVFSFGCFPKSIFVTGTKSLGAFAGGAGGVAVAVGAGAEAAGAGVATGCWATGGLGGCGAGCA
jgi:hypothetical protein